MLIISLMAYLTFMSNRAVWHAADTHLQACSLAAVK